MIIATAGHIDHGKSALVRRLTGMDTDRLPEEKRRGMTIDLGFAPLELPGVGRVGIVDVPGHERFIRNMVAGATGMDMVLLVVAADDGVMPQTIEHLEIARLLGINRGVVAINKSDLANAARLDALCDELRTLLDGTSLASAPIVPVSSLTGAGIEELRAALAEALAAVPSRAAGGFFRLPIDRVFTLPGHGTVVTGTVAGGTVRRDDVLRLLPDGRELRVRGVQMHNRTVETAGAGNRCALNVAGVERQEIERGMMVVDARLARASQTADAWVTLARTAPRAPRGRHPVQMHAGTAEVPGHLLWIEERAPETGRSAYVQLRLERPVPLLYGDRFIVRSRDARHTLGGGVVLDPFAERRGARLEARRIRLARLARLDANDALDVWLESRGETGWWLDDLAEQLGRTPEFLAERLTGRADVLRENLGGKPWLALTAALDALGARLLAAVKEYLGRQASMTAAPLGALQESVCPRLDSRIFRIVVERLIAGRVVEQVGGGVRPPEHHQRFSDAEERLATRIESLLAVHGTTPPKLEALAKALGQPAVNVGRFLAGLERSGRIVKLAAGVYLNRRDFERWRLCAEKLSRVNGRITLAEFRDAIGVGRELALMTLEYFDRQGITRRQGEARVLAARLSHP